MDKDPEASRTYRDILGPKSSEILKIVFLLEEMTGEGDALIVKGDGDICTAPAGCDDGNVVGLGSIVSRKSIL